MKTFKKTYVIAGIAAALLTSACSHQPRYTMEPQELPKNEVEVTTFTHTVNFNGNSGALAPAEQAALEDFILRQGLGYGDQLIVDVNANDPEARTKMAAINNYLKTRGLWAWNISASGQVANASTANLVVNRYHAITPDCLALSQKGYPKTQDARNPTFGCTTAQNLGVMVANPQDLIEGQPDSLPYTAAAVRALQLYRTKIGTTENVFGQGRRGFSSLFGTGGN